MRDIRKTILFFIAICAVFLLFGKIWPPGADYYYVFRPTVEAFLRGDSRLYDELSHGFYNTPWTIFPLIPIALLPLRYGQALLLIPQILALLFVIDLFLEKNEAPLNLLIVGLALVNIHTFGLVASGNIDGFLVLGLGLGWIAAKKEKPWLLGLGLWLLSMKPINVLFVIFVLFKMVWDWPVRDKIIAVLPLVVTVAVSFPIFGLSWPLRYVQAMAEHPPNIKPQTSLWRLFSHFGVERDLALGLFFVVSVIFLFAIIQIKNFNINKKTLIMALSANLVFSPYTLGNHYVLLAPAFAVLAQARTWMLGLWFLTFTPLIRLVWGFKVSWVDIVYPLAIMVGSGYLILKERKGDEQRENAS
jgi:hypothetical protein